ncbi:hypothetical protein [Streptomyces sp. NPDC059991]|uniref:hypothetical protein n=1 Tax=unclassified Streptomyces TaxID=2593676 RepID=UPI0036852ED3
MPHSAAASRLRIAVRVVASVAVLALIAVAIIAVQRDDSSTAGPSAPPDTGRVSLTKADLARLVADHAAALRAKDASAFLAPFSPAVKDGQRRTYANLQKVPFRETGFEIQRTSGRLENSFGGGVKAEVDVVFVHQIDGVDAAPVQEGYRWTVEKKTAQEPPAVTAVAGMPYPKLRPDDADQFVAYPAPWDLYPDLRVTRTAHVVLMNSAEQDGAARAAAPRLEQAAQHLLNTWRSNGPPGQGQAIAPGFALTLEPDATKFATLYGQGGRAGGEAGIAIGMQRPHALDHPFGGARLLVKDPAVRVGAHEMTHAMLMPLTGRIAVISVADTQAWVVEGVAEYLTGGGLDDRGGLGALKRSGFDGKLPDQMTFYGGDATRQAARYELGRLAVAFMAQRYGQNKALAFVAAQYAKPDGLHQQIKDTTGMDVTAFTAAWADYVRSILT